MIKYNKKEYLCKIKIEVNLRIKLVKFKHNTIYINFLVVYKMHKKSVNKIQNQKESDFMVIKVKKDQ